MGGEGGDAPPTFNIAPPLPSTQASLPFPQPTPRFPSLNPRCQTNLGFTTPFDRTHHHKHSLFSSSSKWIHNKPKHSSIPLSFFSKTLSLSLSLYLILIKNPKISNLEISRKFSLSFFEFHWISICMIRSLWILQLKTPPFSSSFTICATDSWVIKGIDRFLQRLWSREMLLIQRWSWREGEHWKWSVFFFHQIQNCYSIFAYLYKYICFYDQFCFLFSWKFLIFSCVYVFAVLLEVQWVCLYWGLGEFDWFVVLWD